MESAADKWLREPRPAPEIVAAAAAGKVWCKGCAAHVPPSFADGCIAAKCGLKTENGGSNVGA
ncbi:hypothetical protein [Croceicoccus mobilis]|nr:hypothetical protein [Croceicoccus mobilis]